MGSDTKRCARRQSLSILPLLLGALLLGGCQDDAAKLAEHIARGREFNQQEKYQEAVIELRNALQLDPNSADAHFLLSRALFKLDKPREGFWELRETVRLDPNNFKAKLEFAELAILGGEQEAALEQTQLVIDKEPTNPRAHLIHGQALLSMNRKEEALDSFRKAVEVAPEDLPALRVLARAVLDGGDLEEAEQLFKRAIEVKPGYETWADYGTFLGRAFGEERVDEAGDALRKALELAEGDDRLAAYKRLAGLYLRHNRFEEATLLIEEGIGKETEEALQLTYFLARIHRGAGNIEKADELIEQTALTRPDDPTVFEVLASYRARNDDLNGALAAIDRALELDPKQPLFQLTRAQILLDLGLKGERESGVAESRALIDQVLAEGKVRPQVLLLDGRHKLLTGNGPEAVTSLRAALDAKPDWPEALHLLGVALSAKGDHLAARAELARALELDPSLLDTKKALAHVHSKLGEWDYAIDLLRAYVQERPGDEKARLMLTQALVQTKDLGGAIEVVEAIPADQRGAEAYFAIGRIEEARGNIESARTAFLAARELQPENPRLLMRLLQLDLREGRLEDSRKWIEEAVAKLPENAQLRQLEGVVAQEEGRMEDAEAAYRKAIELDPSDLGAYRRLARFLVGSGRMEETAQTYEKALEVDPDNANLHHFLGVIYELSGDRERAIERYEDAIRYKPDFGEAKNNLAYLYAETGADLDRALALAQDAAALLPDSPSVSDTMGWVLFRKGMAKTAVSFLIKAEEATAIDDPNLGLVRYHRALAHEANGEPEEALAAVERSLEALEHQMKAGGAASATEPQWAADARSARDRLKASQGG